MDNWTEYEVTFERGGSICERFSEWEAMSDFIFDYKKNPKFGDYYIMEVTHKRVYI